MVKIICYLALIRLRKILPKGDLFAVMLFVFFYCVAVYFLNKLFFKYGVYFIYGSILEIFLYHSHRKDLDLLKRYKYNKLVLFIEYTIYSLGYLFVYVSNWKWSFVGIHFLFVLVLLFLQLPSSITVKYPFRLFNPFWHIGFRKYNLIVFIPLVFFLNYVGWQSNNENLNIASFFLASFFGCLPSFYREELHHIKMSYFLSKKYLLEQVKNTLYNVSFFKYSDNSVFYIIAKMEFVGLCAFHLFFACCQYRI